MYLYNNISDYALVNFMPHPNPGGGGGNTGDLTNRGVKFPDKKQCQIPTWGVGTPGSGGWDMKLTSALQTPLFPCNYQLFYAQ